MCYIQIVKTLRNPDKEVEKQIREILKAQATRNSDGFFIKNGDEELRTLNDALAEPKLRVVALNNLMVHFRWASVGRVKEDNVHGWELGEWRFFHNGGVAGYTEKYGKEQEWADSYLFFQSLYLKLQAINGRKDKQVERVAREVITESNFYGRAALYNIQTDKMYLLGDFHIYCFGDSHIIVSSASLDLNKKGTRKVHGFEFDYSNESSVGELATTGIGVIHNFSRPGFAYRYLGVLRDVNYVKPSVDKQSAPIPTQHYFSPHAPYTEDDDTRYVQQEDSNEEILKAYREANTEAGGEFQEMMDNIDRTEDELDVDPDTISDANGVINEFTPAEVDDAIVQMLQAEFGFIGYDIETGEELFLDEVGIHDRHEDCCRLGTCRGKRDYDKIELMNLENLKFPQMDGIVKIDQVLAARK